MQPTVQIHLDIFVVVDSERGNLAVPSLSYDSDVQGPSGAKLPENLTQTDRKGSPSYPRNSPTYKLFGDSVVTNSTS
jgi:hypothetical protein